MDGFNLFGIGPLELFTIAVIALIVLGPERLPGTFREVAKFIRQLRAISSELTSQFSEEFKMLDELNPRKLLDEATNPNKPATDDKTKKSTPATSTPATTSAAKPLTPVTSSSTANPTSSTTTVAASTSATTNSIAPPKSSVKPSLGETDYSASTKADALQTENGKEEAKLDDKSSPEFESKAAVVQNEDPAEDQPAHPIQPEQSEKEEAAVAASLPA